jgi:hypothetical protein
MKMGEVVETLSHPINGKNGRTDHGGRLSTQIFPLKIFSCKAHIDPNSLLTEECMYRLTKEYADVKILL